MALRRKKAQLSAIDQFYETCEAEDPAALQAAVRGLAAMAQFYPELNDRLSRLRPPRGDTTRPLAEAFVAAQATRAAIETGDSLEGIFNEQVAIAQAQESLGKEWVVGLFQIRCWSIGSMLASMGLKEESGQFGELVADFLEAGGWFG